MYQSTMHPTLYTPATMELPKILALANRVRNKTGVWRMVLCTEDSIHENDVPEALERIRALLSNLHADTPVCLYVRVRNPQVLAQVLEMPDVTRLTGFVVPKADAATFPQFADQLTGTDFRLMPILESRFMPDLYFRHELRSMFKDGRYHGMIDCLCIGANDLMGHHGIRRANQDFTVYDTPVGKTIMDIANEFRGVDGFTVTAPVFELYDPQYGELFRREARQHVMNGLFGQTVINLVHLLPLRDLYSVTPDDLASAQSILGSGRAVYGLNGRMDEYATHWKWAKMVLERHQLFGRADQVKRDSLLLEAYTTPSLT